MNLGVPQIIWLVLVILGLGVELANHGKRKEGRHNFWVQCIAVAINVWILYAGGFFN